MKTPSYKGTKPRAGRMMAGGRGFEPRLTDPESAVLPLDEPPMFAAFYHMPRRASTPSLLGLLIKLSLAQFELVLQLCQ